MANHRLRGTRRDRPGPVPKAYSYCRRFRAIVDTRSRPVQVQVIDLFQAETRFRTRHPHRTSRVVTRGRYLHPMVRVARRSVPDYFGVDVRAALQRVLEILEDQYPRPFAKNKPVTVSVEWPRCASRLIVPLGSDGSHAAERSNQSERDAGFNAAGHNRA